MKKILTLLTLFAGSYSLKAQYWEAVGGGVDFFVRDVYADTIDDILYAVGNFEYAGDSVVNQIGAWKNGAWNKVGNGTNDTGCGHGCNPVLSIRRFNNELFVCGYMDTTWAGSIKSLARWDGSAWSSCGSPRKPPIALSVMNGELFCMGWFDTINGQSANLLAKWNGTIWEEFGTPFFQYGYLLGSGEYYNGKYYFAGNFGMGGGYGEIAGWDGIQWFPLENGLLGDSWVNDIIVYNSYLFVGGKFLQSNGNVADYIMAWDGQNWFDPFPDVQFIAQVADLNVINNNLYIAGPHHIVGDTNVYGLAKFDEINFYSIGGANNFLTKIAGLNDTLYAATQWVCDGDTAKWISRMPMNTPADTFVYQPLNIESQNFSNYNINLYPNPAENNLFITANGNIDLTGVEYSIMNIQGKTIRNGLVKETNQSFYVSDLSAGVYIFQLSGNNLNVSRKFIKK